MKTDRFPKLNMLLLAGVIFACGMVPGMLIPTATPTGKPAPSDTPAPTNTSVPLSTTETLVPTPARPAAPTDFEVDFKCVKLGAKRFHVTIFISWKDNSDDEAGFDLYRNRVLYKSVDANITEATDTVETQHPISGGAEYGIQAFNADGRSNWVDASVAYVCR